MTKEQREEILAKGCIPIEIDGKVIALQPNEESFKEFEKMYPGYEALDEPKVYLLHNYKRYTPLCTKDLNDFGNVENMNGMFSCCFYPETLDLYNFNTSKATDMSNMFYQNANLKLLNLSNFDTSKVSNMSFMFAGCESLQTLDLSNFDTSNVEGMGEIPCREWFCEEMFESCKSLQTVILNKEKNPRIVEELQKLRHEVEIIEPTQKSAQSAASELHMFN